MTVTITIRTASLMSDAEIKSHMQTERIKDPLDRNAVRLGEERRDEARQSLMEAWRALTALCRPFLAPSDAAQADDALPASAGSDDLALALDVTGRRTPNLAQALAQEMHRYLVDGLLRRYYQSAMMPDLASVCAAGETAARDAIAALLYRKMEPVWEEDGDTEDTEDTEENEQP